MFFCKKFLRYCWVYDKKDWEIKCYDDIAKLLYYDCDIINAKYFHNKYINGYIEPP